MEVRPAVGWQALTLSGHLCHGENSFFICDILLRYQNYEKFQMLHLKILYKRTNLKWRKIVTRANTHTYRYIYIALLIMYGRDL